jgi:chromate transport protein ChrA
VTGGSASRLQRIGDFLVEELKVLLPPTIYFFCAFNLIAFTANLVVRHYLFALSNFLLATTLALIVGKVILVTHKFRFLDRYRGPPLIRAILFKTSVYTVVVALVRLLEAFIHIARDGRSVGVAFNAAIDAFTWQHFAAIQTWLFVCFLIYVAVTETNSHLGEGRLKRLLFSRDRP